MSFDEIRFDMSREGLETLSAMLEPEFERLAAEMQNFANVIRNLIQRVPATKTVMEDSWLDE